MPSYKGAGGVRTTAGTTRRYTTVTAPDAETAVEKLKERYDGDRETLYSVYDEWEYALSGALRGNLVWSHQRGFID